MAFQSSALFLFFLIALPLLSHAEIPDGVAEEIKLINSKGPYYALVVPGQEELNAVLDRQAAVFIPDEAMPFIDIAARRFQVGEVEGCRTILVLSGNGSVNAALTTQLLLTHFRMKGVIHYGRAASANPNSLRIGDLAIPEKFAHIGVWFWEKFGGDETDYTRKIANLTFAEYNVGEESVKNRLQSVFFQRETLYSKPAEDGKSHFWFNVDEKLYYTIAQSVQHTLTLAKCVPDSNICLAEQPEVKRVERAGSGNLYVNNEAFRDFLHTKLRIASIDTESAAIAMVCAGEKKSFLAMRSVIDYGGGSSSSNDPSVIKQLWSIHAAEAIKAFFKELASEGNSNLSSVTGGKIW